MSSKLGKRFVRCLDFGVVVAERKETEGIRNFSDGGTRHQIFYMIKGYSIFY